MTDEMCHKEGIPADEWCCRTWGYQCCVHNCPEGED